MWLPSTFMTKLLTMVYADKHERLSSGTLGDYDF
jgi:hypothetical protein